MADRVWKNVHFILEWFKECSPREVENAYVEAILSNSEPIDIKVHNLFDVATNSIFLSLVPPTRRDDILLSKVPFPRVEKGDCYLIGPKISIPWCNQSFLLDG